MSSDAQTGRYPVKALAVDRSTGERIAAIDGFRALAMLMVYSYHVWLFSGSPSLSIHVVGSELSFGSMLAQFPAGVDLFMVLSGFCLFWPIACSSKQKLESWSWRDYGWRRIRRIVPPYYAAILYCTLLPIILVLLYKTLGRPAQWQPLPSLWQYLSHAVFVHTWHAETWAGIQGVFWSLGLEAQFYVVFPIVVFAYKRCGILIAVIMIGLSIVYRIIIAKLVDPSDWTLSFLLSITFLGRWMQFAAGMLAAWFLVRQKQHRQHQTRLIGYALVGIAVTLYIVAHLQISLLWGLFPTRDVALAAAFGVALVGICSSHTGIRRLFEWQPIVWLGFISYSVFLVHMNSAFYAGELLRTALRVTGPTAFAFHMTLGFGVIVAISYVFFRIVESPFLARKHRPQPKMSTVMLATSSGALHGPETE